jgi:hypothetical protein
VIRCKYEVTWVDPGRKLDHTRQKAVNDLLYGEYRRPGVDQARRLERLLVLFALKSKSRYVNIAFFA